MNESLQVAKQHSVRSKPAWLNRNVVGMGLTSLLSDAGHEMATAVLPGFLSVLGVSAAVLGIIEGIADATSSFVKLGAGWLSDRLGHRKPITVGGYFLTGVSKGLFAFAYGWPLVLVGRVLGWFGRGIRGPLRDAMLASSVPPEARGKAFGFHRAGDTLGAIIGPLLGVALLSYLPRNADPSAPFRTVFLLTLIPGLGSAIAFALMVREKRAAPSPRKFWTSLGALPKPFRLFLWGVGIFGMGDYARTLLILAATQLLTPRFGVGRAAQLAALFYVVHNVSYAAYSYPIGALSDRFGRKGLLCLGYLAGTLTSIGFVAAFLWQVDVIVYLMGLFAMAGFTIAVEDALEGVVTADLVTDEGLRGTAYGVLGTVNGVGDLVASVLVGTLWTAISPIWGFGFAAALMGIGTLVTYRLRWEAR